MTAPAKKPPDRRADTMRANHRARELSLARRRPRSLSHELLASALASLVRRVKA